MKLISDDIYNEIVNYLKISSLFYIDDISLLKMYEDGSHRYRKALDARKLLCLLKESHSSIAEVMK